MIGHTGSKKNQMFGKNNKTQKRRVENFVQFVFHSSLKYYKSVNIYDRLKIIHFCN